MQTSLIINATDTSGAVTKTVTDVNSNTPGSVAHEYGRRLTALTTNNFVGVNRVDKEKLDANKTTPTLTLSKASDSNANIVAAIASNDWYTVDITYDGDGKLSVDAMADGEHSSYGMPLVAKINENGQLAIGGVKVNFDTILGFTVRASETDTCNSVTATFTTTN